MKKQKWSAGWLANLWVDHALVECARDTAAEKALKKGKRSKGKKGC